MNETYRARIKAFLAGFGGVLAIFPSYAQVPTFEPLAPGDEAMRSAWAAVGDSLREAMSAVDDEIAQKTSVKGHAWANQVRDPTANG